MKRTKIEQFSFRVMESIMRPQTKFYKGNVIKFKNSGNVPAVIDSNYILFPGESESIGLFEDNNIMAQNIRIEFVGMSGLAIAGIVGPVGPTYPRIDVIVFQKDDQAVSDYIPK